MFSSVGSGLTGTIGLIISKWFSRVSNVKKFSPNDLPTCMSVWVCASTHSCIINYVMRKWQLQTAVDKETKYLVTTE